MRCVFYPDAAGQWRWRVQAGNNEIVATSGEGYHNLDDCEDMARKLFGDRVVYETDTSVS